MPAPGKFVLRSYCTVGRVPARSDLPLCNASPTRHQQVHGRMAEHYYRDHWNRASTTRRGLGGTFDLDARTWTRHVSHLRIRG
jgi:hypothetical protein